MCLRLVTTAFNGGHGFLKLLGADFAFLDGHRGLAAFQNHFRVFHTINFHECRPHRSYACELSYHPINLEMNQFSASRRRRGIVGCAANGN